MAHCGEVAYFRHCRVLAASGGCAAVAVNSQGTDSLVLSETVDDWPWRVIEGEHLRGRAEASDRALLVVCVTTKRPARYAHIA
jgi:hypothetical protein